MHDLPVAGVDRQRRGVHARYARGLLQRLQRALHRVGIVQGAYVVAQGSADGARYDSVIAGGLALLDAVTIRPA